ncbi:Monooxygenase FAD-binding protein [Macrophomina phaseolina MS6]|uniref:Monooxygenase FAD-binding protein n=1 Tax=Macrophomina phaseolina (strain MS6) TaxID=1126212 RepID=K2R8H4_MACPH|nr:Monooxygenase FAD-binding protein [Macrophomina phaseolina MS6]
MAGTDVPFKVIIVGGSLVGLGLALCFERAGIEYELFERGQVAPQLGASIGWHPHGLKLLEQLGVREDMEQNAVPLSHRMGFDEYGRCIEDSKVLREIKKRATRPVIFVERCEALRILHSHVKNKHNIHSLTSIESYHESDNGVSVTTSDGRVVHGSILLGADGIHSTVRSLMADEIAKADPKLGMDLKQGFVAEYKCIFAVSRNNPDAPIMPDATVHNVYYDYYSAIAAAGVPGLIFWFLFIKLPTSIRTPNCPRFGEEDMARTIEEYGSKALGPSYTIKDLWDARVKASMVALEEGVLKKWSHGRVVLIGDSVHKATINAGLGGNTAYEGIACLTNGLVDLLARSPQPSLDELTAVFREYEETHRQRAEFIVKLSGTITRYEAQDTWLLKMASRWLSPWVSDARKADAYASYFGKAPFLNYLPDPDALADAQAKL